MKCSNWARGGAILLLSVILNGGLLIVHASRLKVDLSRRFALFAQASVPSQPLPDFVLSRPMHYYAQSSYSTSGCNMQAFKRLAAAIKVAGRPATVQTGKAAPVAQPSRRAAGPELHA